MGFDGLFSSSDFHLEIFLYSFSRSTFKIFDKLNIKWAVMSAIENFSPATNITLHTFVQFLLSL